MNSKKVAKETARVLQNYLTYQSVLVIIDQLSETNPPQAIWLRQYSSGNKLQDGEAYLQGLMLEHKDLVMRIMAVRDHLAESVLEFLPSMVKTGINQSNLNHRRQLLERLTQTPTSTSFDVSEPESESSNSPLSDEQNSTD